MAENAPPAAANAGADSTRGLPYYEQLRKNLRDTLQKKRTLEKSMALLEDSIYKYEASYLEETGAGNIIKGFDNYIKNSSTSASAAVGTSRKKAVVNESDRVFSRSSASYSREDSAAPTPSAQSTPQATPSSSFHPTRDSSNHATPTSATSAGLGSKNTKKNKKKLDDDSEGEGKPPKRVKVNFGAGRE